MTGDDLRQRSEALETEVLPLAGSPAAETVRRRGRRRQRAIRAAGLLAVARMVAGVARGAEQWDPGPASGRSARCRRRGWPWPPLDHDPARLPHGPADPSERPEPQSLRGYSPWTAAGVGFGSSLAQLRTAYGSQVQVSAGTPGNQDRFRVSFGAGGELSGSLSGGTAAATVTGIAAGAGCGE